MAFLQRVFRTFWVVVFALVFLGVPLVLFAAAKAAQHYLQSERTFGAWKVRVYGADVSPWLSFAADSAVLVSPEARIVLRAPSLRSFDWSHGWTYRPRLQVQLDSAAVRLFPTRRSPHPGPAKFPLIRFLFPIAVQWRVLHVVLPDGQSFGIEQAAMRNRGLVGWTGAFRARWAALQGGAGDTVDVALDARWRGGNVRYRIGLMRDADTVRFFGQRDKADLARGRDSLNAAIADVRFWLPPKTAARLPRFGPISIRAVMDWKAWRLSLEGHARTAAYGLLEPCAWDVHFQEGREGGDLMAGGRGPHQNFRLDGAWAHPAAWPAPPDWNKLSARFSGKVHGVHWKIGAHRLPIEARLLALRLSPGRRVEAEIATGDSSHISARWSGDEPRRVPWSATLSPRETWARIWTDTNVAYAGAQLQGEWDGHHLRATARFRSVRAYGAVLDSVWCDQEVNATGYYLRDARLFDRGETFHGAGQVVWGKRSDTTRSRLEFTLMNPRFGRVRFAMPKADSLVADAEDAQAARFPYRPLRRFEDYHPVVNGRFAWNTATGVGAATLDIKGNGGRREVRGHVLAAWNRAELEIDSVEIASAGSELQGGAVVDLDSASLAGLARVRATSLRAWHLHAEQVQLEEIPELLRRDSGAPIAGVLDGRMAYTAAGGLQGELRGRDLRIPSLHGLFEIPELLLSGRGDSLHLWARTASGRHDLMNDTADIGLAGLQTRDPRGHLHLWTGPLHLRWSGDLPQWKSLQGEVSVTGALPLGGAAGTIDDVDLKGDLQVPFAADARTALRFQSRRFQLRYTAAADTQWLSGSVTCAQGVVRLPDVKIRHSQGGDLNVQAEADLAPFSAHLAFQGPELSLHLPSGLRLQAHDLKGELHWSPAVPATLSATAQTVGFDASTSATNLEGQIGEVKVDCTLPPGDSQELPKVVARAQLREFLFHHKLGFDDLRSFFRSFKRKKGSGTVSARKSKPWNLDLAFDAVGTKNRIDTDVLRVAFVGDLAVKGVYPYTLFRGKITGLNGEIGQPGQAYSVRDCEIKWENATLEQGTIYVEGEKKLLADCKPGTTQQCNISIKLDGTLDAMNFSYDSDCGQNIGEPVTPTVLMNSMTQGCYSAELQGGQGNYGETVLNMLEPQINAPLSRVGSRWTGGFLQSTQVTGLGSLASTDTSNLESVALEVQSKEKYRVSLQAKAGYFPEKNLPDPWEYRLAIKYRPPLERLISDTTWQKRFANRLSIESGVETELEKRNLDIERRVTDEVEVRYHYRFWNLW